MKKNHRLKIYYNIKGDAFFILNKIRYYIKDLQCKDNKTAMNITNCGYIQYDVNFEYGINDYIILSNKKIITF